MSEALHKAAQAVLDRWDSPQWEWRQHCPTADLMHTLRAALAQPPAPTAQPAKACEWTNCPTRVGDVCCFDRLDRIAKGAAQPVQQPGAEPDMRHPKIQALIGSKARCQIELMLVEQLIEDPDCDLTSMDMEYWGPMHDRLKEALTKAAPAQRQPLSDMAEHLLDGFGSRIATAEMNGDAYDAGYLKAMQKQFIEFAAAFGITAAPAAKKGEKL